MNIFWWLKPRQSKKRLSGHTTDAVTRDWKAIDVMLKEGKPSQLKQAMITADRSVDAVLKDLVAGETMGERLKNAREKFDDRDIYQGLWDAHKVRNALVHESGYEPQHFTLKKNIEKIRDGLVYLGVRV